MRLGLALPHLGRLATPEDLVRAAATDPLETLTFVAAHRRSPP